MKKILSVLALAALLVGIGAGPAAASTVYDPSSGRFTLGHAYLLTWSQWSMEGSQRYGTTSAYGHVGTYSTQSRVQTPHIVARFYKPSSSTPVCTFDERAYHMAHNCGGNFTNGWVVFTVDVPNDGSGAATVIAYFR